MIPAARGIIATIARSGVAAMAFAALAVEMAGRVP